MLGMKVPGPSGASFEIREDPDGLLCTVLDGEFSEDMGRALGAACLRMVESGREVVLLCDARRAGALPPAARKVLADEMRGVRLPAVAVVGASFTMRVAATLTAKSIEFLTGRSYPVKFVATEAEGRAWLLTQRDALRAKRGPVA
ncbi:hypothetical protein SOCE26_067900 [Sorangium cellulosum]|uniref:STAS/SEC14 domain-containing protein n=1 Tax=Sorangium cellulosum TaxID=56 RepID=A0A2L0F153_SORCE|nr:STAS/SEC14 domain-containing protein [Sorangium cellulosum]AUX45308.1 hypothetical protein SOCE26_067900 [Sorangium cellulosum]